MSVENTKYKDSLLYKSGDVFLPKSFRQFLETPIYGHYDKTQIYLTLWSIMHMISGFLLELILKYYFNLTIFKNRLFIGFIIHTLWEIWQIIIKMSSPYRLTGKNGLIDILIDTIMFLLGMTLANYFTLKI